MSQKPRREEVKQTFGNGPNICCVVRQKAVEWPVKQFVARVDELLADDLYHIDDVTNGHNGGKLQRQLRMSTCIFAISVIRQITIVT